MQVLSLNDFIAVVEARDGYFLVNRKDFYIGQSIEIYGEHGWQEAEFLKKLVQPGDTVIEVGANIGAHTVGLAKAVGPQGAVHAFEPQRACFALLQAQIALNQLGHVHAQQKGVGKERGALWVPKVNYAAPGNFGGISLATQQAQGSERVEVVTLDDEFGDRPCALLKIDVEGMEEAVIRGGANLIRRQKPVLYVENDRPEKSKALVVAIQELGYRLWWHIPALFNPENYFGVKENAYGQVGSFNMLCAPAQHAMSAGLVEIKSPDDRHPLTPAPTPMGLSYTIKT